MRDAKLRLDSTPFLVEAFLNKTPLLAFFDPGCLPYAAFSERLVRKQNLPRIPVATRQLRLAKNEEEDLPRHIVNEMTYAVMDIGRGDYTERLYGYIIPNLHYDVILGKGWAERNRVIYDAPHATSRQ